MKIREVLKAADTAARWHSTQKRKGADAEPYINHLLEVASLVADADHGNTDLIVAALLHDTIEDQKISHGTLVEEFNERVADLISEVTDDKTIPKQTRKALQIENAAKKSRDARLLGLADKISNLRSLATSPPAHWSLERRGEYIAWSRQVVDAGLKGHSEFLDQQFGEAAALAEQSLGTLESAISIAAQAHAGQVDKAGQPYITHCLRVMMRVEGIDKQITAVLHDVVEDCPGWTFGKLAAHGFSEEIIEALRLLTRDPATELGYEDYVMRAAANPIARAVKLADLEDNCDLSRISNPTQADFDRIAKYQRVIALLEEARSLQS